MPLRAIYLSTNGDNWNIKTGWPSAEEFKLNLLPPPNTDYSKWHGVYCTDGRVFWLWFNENNLTGVLPEEIGNLDELTDIIIDWSPIGGEIPSTIGKLKKLKKLQLQNNKFSGKIPKELYELVNLNRLDLRSNNFSSKIPKELGKLKRLIVLDLAYNEFSAKLSNFYVENNVLSGKIPEELFHLKDLKYFNFNGNELDENSILKFKQLKGEGY